MAQATVVVVLLMWCFFVTLGLGQDATRVREVKRSTVLWGDHTTNTHVHAEGGKVVVASDTEQTWHGLQRRLLEMTVESKTWPIDLIEVKLVYVPRDAFHDLSDKLAPLIYTHLEPRSDGDEWPFVLSGLYVEATYQGNVESLDLELSRIRSRESLRSVMQSVFRMSPDELLHAGILPSISGQSWTANMTEEAILSFDGDKNDGRKAGPKRLYFHSFLFSRDQAGVIVSHIQPDANPFGTDSSQTSAFEMRIRPTSRKHLDRQLSVTYTHAYGIEKKDELTYQVASSISDSISILRHDHLFVIANTPPSTTSSLEMLTDVDSLVNYTRPIHMGELGRSTLVKQTRSLEKSGFHREIVTDATFTLPSKTDGTPQCSVAIVEFLPQSVFVDKYQADELHRFSGPRVHIYDEFDLEKPSSDVGSHQGVVVVHAIPTSYSRTDERVEFSISVTLPIHLRYQNPSHNTTHRPIQIPHPLFYVSCEPIQSHESSRTWIRAITDDSQHSSAVLELSVPVGEMRRQTLVTTITLLATILGSAIVLVFLWRHGAPKKSKSA